MSANVPEAQGRAGEHTPGEWLVDDDRKGRTLMVIARRGGMALIVNEVGRPATATDRANARLIAAAPDLLEALRAMCSCEYGTKEAVSATIKARAAISKAEGR